MVFNNKRMGLKVLFPFPNKTQKYMKVRHLEVTKKLFIYIEGHKQ